MQDAKLILSEDQDLSQVVADYASTNVIDFGSARDVGAGGMIEVCVQVTETFVGASATLQVAAQGSTDNSTFYTYLQTPAIGVAALVAGQELLRIKLPVRQPLLTAPLRYFRLLYTIAGATTTAGTCDAYLTAAPDREQIYQYARNYVAA